MRKKLIIGIAVLALIAILTWAYMESTKPLPGEEALQNSRNHIPEGSPTSYKSNPPTSGDHYTSWTKKGFYDTPRIDGNLVHSLEHGYIIFWYDCEKKLADSGVQSSEFRVQSKNGEPTNQLTNNLSLIPTVYAHEASESANSSSSAPVSIQDGEEGSPSAKLEDLPKAFSDGSCKEFKAQLKDLYSQFGEHKLIIVPRVGMDHPLILTSWGRILKLDKADKDKIKRFIDFFRDHGPEQTNEP